MSLEDQVVSFPIAEAQSPGQVGAFRAKRLLIPVESGIDQRSAINLDSMASAVFFCLGIDEVLARNGGS